MWANIRSGNFKKEKLNNVYTGFWPGPHNMKIQENLKFRALTVGFCCTIYPLERFTSQALHYKNSTFSSSILSTSNVTSSSLRTKGLKLPILGK
jgi:hypothetical protein